MREIPLTQGKVAIVDDEDYPALSQWRWFAYKSEQTYYAARSTGKYTSISMHRHILRAGPGEVTDHKNHNGLDNRKCNLRITDVRGNAENRRDQSVYGIGIRRESRYGKGHGFQAQVHINKKCVHVGYYASAEEARKARAHFLHAYRFSCALAGI